MLEKRMCNFAEITTHSPFKELSSEHCETILSSFQFHRFSQKTVLTNQGRKVFYVGMIVKGSADMTVSMKGQDHVKVETLGKGDFFGDLLIPGENVSIVKVTATEPLECYVQPIDKFHNMLKNSHHIGEYYHEMTMKKMIRLFQKLNISSFSFGEAFLTEEPKMDSIEKSLRYINRNYMQQITLEKVAKEVGMSKYHFSRTFKSKTGFSFREYINMKRIERAKQLMQDEDINVSEVCYLTGFNDVSYFCRIFRKHEKITPSEFMKNI